MKVDFSKLNLQYLIQVRDLARQAPEHVTALVGLPPHLTERLARLTAEDLTRFVQIRLPLLVPRWESWWWERLLQAVQSGRAAEVEAVLAHTGLLATE